MGNLRVERRFGSLADIAKFLRMRAEEIKAIHQETKINKARNAERAEAYEEVARMLDDSTIVGGTDGQKSK